MMHFFLSQGSQTHVKGQFCCNFSKVVFWIGSLYVFIPDVYPNTAHTPKGAAELTVSVTY